MTEFLIYAGVAASVFLFLVFGNVRQKPGLTPTRSLDSSDVAHAVRRRQRPR